MHLVRDADAAAAVYERLGFHVRPLAEHKDIGSRNRVVHFGHTYLEFADFEGAREDVAGPYTDRFQLGEGLAHVSLTSDRLEDDRARLEAVGMQPYPILSARRRITLPDGSFGETASRCFYLWREDNRYLSLFFSDHPKPDMIFIPEFVRHDNGASEVSRCVYMSTTLAADRDYFSRCFGSEPVEEASERIAWQGPRGDLTEVLSPAAAQVRYGDLLHLSTPEPLPGIGIALHYRVADIERCRAVLEAGGLAVRKLDEGAIGVAAEDAVGCIAVFESLDSK
ncbi:conserved hypothetical protein [Luminiphilus syltensis NOR5-1B]|uniref:VOC domain-containing protein n=1 Tax=Luminiphilus syltensis NOR5-1B TaxID=565045 RepID=B8KY28_9GAMM|nr:conserved hypothetical protein [Luminiphilus syltensis NOR5-1B]